MQSDNSHNRQWRSKDAWRGHDVRQRIGYILDNESPRKHASSFVARKALRWKRAFLHQRSKKPHLIKKRCSETQCNKKNFVRIQVPWLFSEFFLQFSPSSTSMTSSKQEIDHPTSSSSSSTSPTVTVSSDSENRAEACLGHSDPTSVSSSQCRAATMGFETHVVYRWTFFCKSPTASSSAPYPQESNPWISNVSEHTITTCDEWKTNTSSGSEMPVKTINQKFSHHQWGRIFKEWRADQQRLQISDLLHFDKFTTSATFACWKIRFKTEVWTCSQISYGSYAVDQRSGDGWIHSTVQSMSGVLGRWHRLPHVRALLMKDDATENKKYIKSVLDLFSIPYFYIRKATARSQVRKERRWSRIPHCKSTLKNAGNKDTRTFTIDLFMIHGSENPCWNWIVQKKQSSRWTDLRTKITPTLPQKKNSTYVNFGFRHDAHKASPWLQTSVVNLASPQESRMKLIIKIGGKALPHRGGNGKIPGGIPHLSSPRRRTWHWSNWETCENQWIVYLLVAWVSKRIWCKITVINSVTANAVQKTMVKRSVQQERKLWQKCHGQESGNQTACTETLGDFWQWEFNGQCVKGNNCSFRHDMNKRGKNSPSNPSPNSFMRQNERKPSRTRSPGGKSPSGRIGTCNDSFCGKWQIPECLYYKTKSGCRFGEKCSFAHRQVDEQPTKMSKTNNDKSAVAMLKKGNWQEREFVSDACHDRPGQPVKRSDEKLGQNSSKTSTFWCKAIGLRVSGHDAAEVYSPEGHRHAEANPTCEIQKGCCTSPRKNSRPKFFARHQSNPSPSSSSLQNERNASRTQKSQRQGSQ